MSVDVNCRKIRNVKNVNKPAKCEFITENVKIEYYFENKANSTMYPKKINVFKKNKANKQWNHYRRIEYVNFTVQSDGKKIVNENLPIGLECERKNEGRYHSVLPPFKLNFYFDYDFSLNYVDEKTKKPVSKKYSGSISAVSSSHFRDIHPSESHTYVNQAFNEETNEKMINFYDGSSKTSYDYYPERKSDNNQCSPQSYSKSINWFYFQDLFAQNHNIFDFSNDYYSYLGSWKEDGINSLVYERIIRNLNKTRLQNNELVFVNGHSKNLNNIISEHVVAIYYYNLVNETRFIKPLTMPFKMKFLLKGKDEKQDVGTMILDIKNYYPEIKDDAKIFDSFKNCLRKSSGYDQFTIKYIDYKEKLKKIGNILESTKQYLRNNLPIFMSPFRMMDMEVDVIEDFDKTNAAIIVNFRLYDPLNAEMHFKVTEDEYFEDCVQGSETIENIFDSELCARKCLENENCGAYYYDKVRTDCKTCKMKNWNSYLEDLGSELDFSKFFKTIKKNGSKLGKRSSFFNYPRHISNDDLIKRIKSESKTGFLDLFFDTEHDGLYIFKFKEMETKRIEED